MDKVAILTEALNRNALERNNAIIRMQECQGRVSEVQADYRRSQTLLNEMRRSEREAAAKLESADELVRDSSSKPPFLFEEQRLAANQYNQSQARLKEAIARDDDCRNRLAGAERRFEEARAEVDRLATACSDAAHEIAQYRN